MEEDEYFNRNFPFHKKNIKNNEKVLNKIENGLLFSEINKNKLLIKEEFENNINNNENINKKTNKNEVKNFDTNKKYLINYDSKPFYPKNIKENIKSNKECMNGLNRIQTEKNLNDNQSNDINNENNVNNKQKNLHNNCIKNNNLINEKNNLIFNQNTVDIEQISSKNNKVNLNEEVDNDNINYSYNEENIWEPPNSIDNNQSISCQNINNNVNNNSEKNLNNFNNTIYCNDTDSVNNKFNNVPQNLIMQTEGGPNSPFINASGIDYRSINPDDYLIKMFGKLGWICRHCNNFNFETRNKCNRCQAVKNPILKVEMTKKKENKKKLKKKKKERKTDWLCLNCYNINYGFRNLCNRCSIERQITFPTVYLEPNQKINGNDNNDIIMNNLNLFQYSINNYNINKYPNYDVYENNKDCLNEKV